MEWDLNFYCTVLYLETMLHHTAEPGGRLAASSIHHIIFIKTENINVDEIGRIIFIRTSTRSIIFLKLLCMHDAMTCNIVAIL